MIQIFIVFLLFYLCESKTNNPPMIIEQPQDIIAELDKPMAIHCRAESSSLDDLQIQWYKDGRLVTTDPNARIITEFMALHVINTMPQDAGVYYCIAKNSYGQTQSRKARIQFLKLDKEFLVSPSSTTAAIGERIHFHCQPPYGSPSPIVYWTKDGKNLSLPLDQNDLILPSIEKSDFGIYRCIASNGLIRQSLPAYLTEFQQPKISIQPSKSRIDLRRGESIYLECQVDQDQYEFEWHFQNKTLRNHTINISSIDFNQSGIYTCIAYYEKYTFYKQILLAVYDHQIINNQEIIYSQTNLTAFYGQPLVIECQLPINSEKKISWMIFNETNRDQIQYDYIDSNHYQLKIPRIDQHYHQIIFQCSYENQTEQSHGLVQLNVEQWQSPPIISYIPNNQTVPIGTEIVFTCQSNDQNHVQWLFIPFNRPYKTIKIDNNRKYRIETNHDLIIRHVEKSDAGMYKCITKNSNNDQTIWRAYLNVEDPRSNAVFQRVERKDLPEAPSPPTLLTKTENSLELTWSIQSPNILDYVIEYYELKFYHKNLEWKYLKTKNANTQQILTNLKSNCLYQFQIRARNSFGYGLPSKLSDLIEIKSTQTIYLYDPINIQETSVTIQWKFYENLHTIQQYSIYVINKKDSKQEYIETIQNSFTTYTVKNLRPYTDYMIYLVASSDIINYSSNKISVRTLESTPSSPPMNINVHLQSTTSLSIQWNSPLENETNGEILAYKINCLTSNETNSIRITNISSDAKGLLIKNLIENLEYCISISARTRIGYGPYSSPICVTMNERFLHQNHNGLKYHLHEAISQPWFLPVIILSSIFFTCIFSYGIWLCFHSIIRQNHRIKFNSSSSSNQSVELPIQKTLSNGKRYDLIKDTPPPPPLPPPPPSTALWVNSIPNSIRLQCCTTTGSTGSSNEQYTMTIHKNPINALLHESRQQQTNPYATTGIFQPSTSPSSPNYSGTVHSLQRSPVSPSCSSSAQYQPPWLDPHHSSSTLQYRSQHNCVHCTSQSHPHTPSSIRTTIRSPSSHRHIKTTTTTNDSIQITMNSSSLPKQLSPNPMMINSLGGETMTTSWSSSTDDNHHHESHSSSSTDKNEHGKSNHISSEASIFSDTDLQQEEDSNTTALVNFERGPSFFSPNVK